MQDNVIISFADRLAADDGAPIKRKRRAWGDCTHEATLISETDRNVTCRKCAVVLDPIDVLLDLARRWERWQDEYGRLMQLRADYDRHDQEVWERRRDRHLNANPTHAIDPLATSWGQDGCRVCRGIEVSCPQSVKRALRAAAAFPDGSA